MSAPRRPGPIDDTERDAWLSEALRHAPDAQAAPPPALSESILRQARVATRDAARPPPRRSVPGAAWAWLVQPPVAAGFASLLVATTVGLMWWDRPIDQTLVRPPATVPSPPPAAAPVRHMAPAPLPEAVTPPTAAVPHEKPAVPKPQARRAESGAGTAEPQRARDAALAAAPRAAASSAPAPSPSDNAAAIDRRGESAATDAALLPRSAPKAAAPAAAFTAQRSNDRAPRPPALAALLDSVAAEPEHWSWQRAGESRAMNPALRRWLVQFDNAAASRWRSSTTDPATPATASALRLYRDGTPAATLYLTDDAVGLAPALQAKLPAASIAALRQALEDATR